MWKEWTRTTTDIDVVVTAAYSTRLFCYHLRSKSYANTSAWKMEDRDRESECLRERERKLLRLYFHFVAILLLCSSFAYIPTTVFIYEQKCSTIFHVGKFPFSLSLALSKCVSFVIIWLKCIWFFFSLIALFMLSLC